MAEILLPTAAKQNDIQTKVTDVQSKTNAIQTTVNNIASNFPLDISGGTDFSLGQSIYSSVASAHGSNEVLEVTGEGMLVSLFIPGSGSTNYYTYLQIDNGTIREYRGGSGAASITVLAKFNQSLKVTASHNVHPKGCEYKLY